MMRSIIRILLLSTNISFIICMLLCFWSAFLGVDNSLLPSLFTILLPLYILLNVFFFFFWLVFHRWYALFSFFALLISFSSLKQVFPFRFTGVKKEYNAENSFSVMTYNTHELSLYKKHSETSENKVIQYVLDTDADIVCLQEVVVIDNKDYLTEEDLIRIFVKYPYKHFYYKRNTKSWRTGIATFSKYPILDKQTISIPSNYSNSAIYSDILVGNDTIRVLNCHLESNRLTGEDKYPSIKKMKTVDEVSNFTGKINQKLGVASEFRAQQANSIAEEKRKSPYKMILCGDFNDTPFSYVYTKVKGDFRDTFADLSCGYGATFNESFFRFRIDYIFCDKALNPLYFHRDRVKYSDHYPLFCVFEKNISTSEEADSSTQKL